MSHVETKTVLVTVTIDAVEEASIEEEDIAEDSVEDADSDEDLLCVSSQFPVQYDAPYAESVVLVTVADGSARATPD